MRGGSVRGFFLIMEENKNAVQVFSNPQFGEIRTCGTAENPMFCLADLCRALDLENSRMVKTRLNPRGVITNDTPTAGGMQKMTYVDEPNMYRCIFQSRKQEAMAFQNWVYEDVLPTMRKQGGYGIPKEEMIQIPRSDLEAIEYGYRKLWERCQRQSNVIKLQGKKNTKLLAQMEVARTIRKEKAEALRIESRQSVEDFVTDMGYAQSNNRTPLVTIFALYVDYCKAKDVKHAACKALSQVLSDRGFEKGRMNYGTYFCVTRKSLPYDSQN